MSSRKHLVSLKLDDGAVVTKISTDGTFASNSDSVIPTEKAIKSYVDVAGGGHLQNTDEGTTHDHFLVNSDSVLGNMDIAPTTGAADATMTITNTAMTGDVTITIPGGASDTVTTLTATQILTNKRLTSPKINEDVILTATATQLNTIGPLATNATKEIVTVPLSFETNEQTATKIYFNHKVTVNKIRSIVMKAVAGTDDATITGANSTGDSNNGVVTVAQSSALNEEDEASPNTNNVVNADSYYKLTTAKTTPGGKVLVTLEVTRTA